MLHNFIFELVSFKVFKFKLSLNMENDIHNQQTSPDQDAKTDTPTDSPEDPSMWTKFISCLCNQQEYILHVQKMINLYRMLESILLLNNIKDCDIEQGFKLTDESLVLART